MRTADGNLRTARLPGLWPGWDVEAAFWRHVEKTEHGWIWTGLSRGGGQHQYGLFAVCVQSPRGPAWRHESAHRISYELFVGPIPEGLHILHSCDIGLCVWPDHLRCGTHNENMADKIARNRHPRGGRVPGIALPRATLPTQSGERHWASKTSDAAILALREAYAAGGVSAIDLARRYGIAKTNIYLIVRGEARRRAGGPLSEILPVVGERVPGAKLTADRVREIRALRATGATIYAVAEQFDIAPQTISKICRRESWKHVV